MRDAGRADAPRREQIELLRAHSTIMRRFAISGHCVFTKYGPALPLASRPEQQYGVRRASSFGANADVPRAYGPGEPSGAGR